MKLKVKADSSRKMKKGQVIEVDKMMYAQNSRTGLLVRVIGVYKKPVWYDIGWFEIDEQKPRMFYGRKAGK